MRAVISVVGCDAGGISAQVSKVCADGGVNSLDISQTVLQDDFTMIMITDIDQINIPFTEFVDRMAALGKSLNLEIHAMHEDIFNAMHRI